MKDISYVLSCLILGIWGLCHFFIRGSEVGVLAIFMASLMINLYDSVRELEKSNSDLFEWVFEERIIKDENK